MGSPGGRDPMRCGSRVRRIWWVTLLNLALMEALNFRHRSCGPMRALLRRWLTEPSVGPMCARLWQPSSAFPIRGRPTHTYAKKEGPVIPCRRTTRCRALCRSFREENIKPSRCPPNLINSSARCFASSPVLSRRCFPFRSLLQDEQVPVFRGAHRPFAFVHSSCGRCYWPGRRHDDFER